jgi:hypothetical protein
MRQEFFALLLDESVCGEIKQPVPCLPILPACLPILPA